MKKSLSRLMLGGILIASVALFQIDCTDTIPSVTFTVTFDTNGGIPAVKDKTVEKGKTLAKPTTNLTKLGYTFTEWYKDEGLTQAFDFSTAKIIANITLYAKWTINTYTVTFNPNNETAVSSQSVEHGNTVPKSEDPTKPGYTFTGWHKGEGLTQAFDFSTDKIIANITLYAKWTINTYTVTFNPNNETAVSSQSVEHGNTVPKPEDPTKPGYTFAGWSQDEELTRAFDFASEKITANITLYAKWVVAYTVTFNTNGGEPSIEDKTVEADKPLAKPTPAPTKEGYTFAGWYKDKELTQAFDFTSEKIIANITLYAKWTINTYTVTFNPNNETAISSRSVAHGSALTEPETPTKEGHTFAGWHKDKEITQAFDFTSETITANITLYAKWTINTYTVTFNPNNETAVSSRSVAYGSAITEPETPTKEGHTFAGWYKDKELTQAFDFTSDNITTNITLYAKWTINTYTVTFNYNDGGTTSDLQRSVNYREKVSDPNPTRTGHIFSNWYSNTALTTVFDLTTGTITQDTTLYAKWTINTYTVTFNPNNETAVSSRSVAYGSAITEPETPTKEGHTFAGWHKDKELTQAFDFTSDNIIANITLYAKWNPIEYTVTFNTGGDASSIDPKKVNYGQLASKPEDPIKARHALVAWFKELSLTNEFDFDIEMITEDITLYAKWKSSLVGIPDANFRAKLKELIPTNAFVGDSLDSKNATVTSLTILRVNDSNIQSLEGLEHFTALTTLSCYDNQLTGLDMSGNTALTKLYCWNNNLTQLNVSNNATLLLLYCRNNRLTNLDVSNNTALKELYCRSNYLTRLDMSSNIALTELHCRYNKLTHLSVPNNEALTELNCNNNQLDSLDIPNNTALIQLHARNNKLTYLNVSNNTALTMLDCDNNQLIRLDLSGNTALTKLYASNNDKLTNLDMRGMRNLIGLTLYRVVTSGFDRVKENNTLEALKVHENLKDHEQIKKVKTARGDELTISTYSAADGSTTYTAVCNDYDPTADDGTGVCNDAP